jgi:hypothetical protein
MIFRTYLWRLLTFHWYAPLRTIIPTRAAPIPAELRLERARIHIVLFPLILYCSFSLFKYFIYTCIYCNELFIALFPLLVAFPSANVPTAPIWNVTFSRTVSPYVNCKTGAVLSLLQCATELEVPSQLLPPWSFKNIRQSEIRWHLLFWVSAGESGTVQYDNLSQKKEINSTIRPT